MTRRRRDGYTTPPDKRCPLDGQPLHAFTSEPGKPTVYVHTDGRQHEDHLGQLVDVPVVPRFEIFAVRPGPAGTMIHLTSPGYRPGAKSRSCQDTAALCGPSVHPLTPERVAPLPDALGWTEPHQHADGCPRPAWRWCRPCLGHAATIAGLATETAIAVAERQRGAR